VFSPPGEGRGDYTAGQALVESKPGRPALSMMRLGEEAINE